MPIDTANQEPPQWPFWKFDYNPNDINTTLYEKFNTCPAALQEHHAFYCDVVTIANETSSREELHARLQDRRTTRLRELSEAMRKIALKVITSPGHSPTSGEHLDAAIQVFRTMSLGAIVNYFGLFMPPEERGVKEYPDTPMTAHFEDVGESPKGKPLVPSTSVRPPEDRGGHYTEDPLEKLLEKIHETHASSVASPPSQSFRSHLPAASTFEPRKHEKSNAIPEQDLQVKQKQHPTPPTFMRRLSPPETNPYSRIQKLCPPQSTKATSRHKLRHSAPTTEPNSCSQESPSSSLKHMFSQFQRLPSPSVTPPPTMTSSGIAATAFGSPLQVASSAEPQSRTGSNTILEDIQVQGSEEFSPSPSVIPQNSSKMETSTEVNDKPRGTKRKRDAYEDSAQDLRPAKHRRTGKGIHLHSPPIFSPLQALGNNVLAKTEEGGEIQEKVPIFMVSQNELGVTPSETESIIEQILADGIQEETSQNAPLLSDSPRKTSLPAPSLAPALTFIEPSKPQTSQASQNNQRQHHELQTYAAAEKPTYKLRRSPRMHRSSDVIEQTIKSSTSSRKTKKQRSRKSRAESQS